MLSNRIYKIDEEQLGKLKRRLLIRMFKYIGFVLLIITTCQVIQAKKGEALIIEGVLVFTSGVMITSALKAVKKIVNSYKTLQIILSDESVEVKAEMSPYKSIRWENLIVQTKSNGTINLYDNSISSFQRKMYGKGWIAIQPETLNKEALLAELMKHQQVYI